MKRLYLKRFFSILIILFITYGCVFGQSSESYIDVNNIKSSLDLLTSAELEGRLIGTKGNNKTLEYIENHFKSYGLSSFSDKGYRKEFEAVSFAWDGVPKFNVIDEKGTVVNSYEASKDFVVRLDSMSVGGSFNGRVDHITDSKEIFADNDKFKKQAVLIDYEDPQIKKLRFSQDQVDDRLYYIRKSSLIIYPESNPIKEPNINLGYKNKLIPTNGIIKIGVNKDVYEQLVTYTNKGYVLDIDIPISFYETTSSNVYGFIPGTHYPNGDFIIIASSIDGIGTNWNEEHYPGASDNAVSMSLMLELARVLTSRDKKIDSTVVFAGFNGKHTGSVGVIEYLRNPVVSQEQTEIIYLDKISGLEDSILKINTLLNPRIKRLSGKKILNQFASIANKLKIPYELNDKYMADEYALFRNSGILASALTYNQYENVDAILDTASNINISKVIEVGILIDEYISYYGNYHLISNLGYIVYDAWYLIVIGFMLLFLKHTKQKLSIWLNEKKIMTIYLVIAFLIIVLTMQTKHSISESTGALLQNTHVTLSSLSYMLAINIFTTLPMMAYLSIVVVLIIISITILYCFTKNLNKNVHLLIGSMVTYFIFMIGFNKFYDYKYSIVYPKLLSGYNSQYIVVLIILLFTLFVVFTFNKEMKETNPLKSMILLVVVFLILTTFTYSPYVFSKEIVDLKATGSILKL